MSNIKEVAINKIKVKEHFRKIDLARVDDLVKSILAVGLINPIVINRNFELIAGNHRLQAYREIGFNHIECRVLNLLDLEKQLLRCDENLIRLDLNVIERAEHLSERDELLISLGRRAKVGDNQYRGSPGSQTTKSLAKDLGISRSKYYEIKSIYKIEAGVREILKQTDVANNLSALMLIQKQEILIQSEVAKRIIAGCNLRDLIKDVKREAEKKKQLKELDAYKISFDTNNIKLCCGDFRNHKIEDNSVQLIWCDPPYTEDINLYGDLAEFGQAVLTDGGSLLCYITQSRLKEVIDLMCDHLTYYWIISIKNEYSSGRDGRGIFISWKPILWWVKGNRKRSSFVADHMKSKNPEKILHRWEQSSVEAEYYIKYLTDIGDVVCDPMAGTGTTAVASLTCGRKFVGYEIERSTYDIARGRVNQHLKEDASNQMEF